MKSFIISLCLFFIYSLLFSQAPQGIPYQAVLRNVNGNVLSSSSVTITFMIHDISASGNIVYQESHSLNTNAQGLVSCVMGQGVATIGTFSNVNWGSGDKYLHLKMDSLDLGTQQMLSVPYALFSDEINVHVSSVGDTLIIGDQFIIVPGISAANATVSLGSGFGSLILQGNATCLNEFISRENCGDQQTIDYFGRNYNLIEINGQCWFADNLATEFYRNGDSIVTELNDSDWSTTNTGAYSLYNDDSANDAIYGKLYNWYATVDSRSLCPAGWHVPTDCEWMFLEGSMGMPIHQQDSIGFRGANVGGALKASTIWSSPNTGAIDSMGFSVLPSGYRRYTGLYYYSGYYGNGWSSSENDMSNAWGRRFDYNNSSILRNFTSKQSGFFVRCVKGETILGCMDNGACNYNELATRNDYSCFYPNDLCDDNNINTINDEVKVDCICQGIPIQSGCTNSMACNYNSNANTDDGTCLIIDSFCDDGDINTISDVVDANCVCSGVLAVYGCTNPQACNFEIAANIDNGLCLIQNSVCDDGNGSTFNDHIDFNCNCVGISVVVGCTNPQACNYNSSANVDDGNCLFQGNSCNDGNINTINDTISATCLCIGLQAVYGCMDPLACNYNPNANLNYIACLIPGHSCNDGNSTTSNDVVDNNCVCSGTPINIEGTGAQLLPGNATCQTQHISVTGCGGQTSLLYDGRNYNLVEIGGQCWFAENLATDQYRNGNLIPTALDNANWFSTTQGAYAIYNDDPLNDAVYGKLYNWYTTIDSRGLCPIGWHVPSDCEWMYMESILGLSYVQQQAESWRGGSNEGGILKTTNYWNSPNTGGVNSIGFSALPAGRKYYDGSYVFQGQYGFWWSKTPYLQNNSWFRDLQFNISSIGREYQMSRNTGMSVRCIKD